MPRLNTEEIDLMTMKAAMVKSARMLRAWSATLIELAEQAEHFVGAVDRLMEIRRDSK